MSVEPAPHQISLQKEDCAVIFKTGGELDVIVPSREEGEAIPPQMLYALLVQEMLKDHFMMKVLTDRIIAAGILGTKGNENA
jgi:hypothetical protein